MRRLEQDAKEAEKNWRKVLKSLQVRTPAVAAARAASRRKEMHHSTPTKTAHRPGISLQVLFYLLAHGSDGTVDAISERVYTFAKIEDTFHASSSPRADQAGARDAHEGAKLVRAKAHAVLDLLRSPAAMADARQQARQARTQYVGFSAKDASCVFRAPPAFSTDEHPAAGVKISTAGRAHSNPVRSFSLGGSSLAWPRTSDEAAFTAYTPPTSQLPPPPKGIRAVVHAPPPGGAPSAPMDLLSSLSLEGATHLEGAPSEFVSTTWQEFVSGPPAAGAASEQSQGAGGGGEEDPFEGLLLEQSQVLGEQVFLESAKAATVAKSPMMPEAAAQWSPPSPTKATAPGDAAAAGRALLSQPAGDEQLRMLWPSPGQAAAASLLDM